MTQSTPGPTKTVPPPLERRRIGIWSNAQALEKTSSARRPEAPSTTAYSGGSQSRRRALPRPASASIRSASSSARLAATVGRVRSRNRIADGQYQKPASSFRKSLWQSAQAFVTLPKASLASSNVVSDLPASFSRSSHVLMNASMY